jgi:hypothetical protein
VIVHQANQPNAMKTAPTPADRITDAIALLMVLGGIAMFMFARMALGDIADGTRVAPPGMSNIAITDLHVAQSKMGLWVIGLGVAFGVVAAVRHRSRGNAK